MTKPLKHTLNNPKGHCANEPASSHAWFYICFSYIPMEEIYKIFPFPLDTVQHTPAFLLPKCRAPKAAEGQPALPAAPGALDYQDVGEAPQQ